MAEEHRCQAPPEGPRLCANNCGFFGSAATQGLCSKCYRDRCLKQDHEAAAKVAVEKTLAVQPPTPTAAPSSSSIYAAAAATAVPPPPASVDLSPPPVASPCSAPGRCRACRKRVGLTGFACRCGDTYCGSHRYPEQHQCTFDFKSAGRDAIARANPVVRAEKVDKI